MYAAFMGSSSGSRLRDQAGKSYGIKQVLSPFLAAPRMAACRVRKNIMKSSTKNRMKGSLRETTGKIKKTVGKVARSRRLAAEGRVEEGLGRAQRRIGQVEKDLEE
jgi:uncharacterized protein YjbJ (UPF0337 family)